MADQKISQLPALTTPSSTDVLAIVDIGANTTKKIEVGNLVRITETTTGTGSDGSFGQGALLIELSGVFVCQYIHGVV